MMKKEMENIDPSSEVESPSAVPGGKLVFERQSDLTSWGRVLRREQRVARPRFADGLTTWATTNASPRLAVGLRRSYGNTVFSEGAEILDMTGLDRLISFDPGTGAFRAEAGLSFDELMYQFAPRRFFPNTCPGTRYVTLGGAVANDVHGKNHSRAGTFGCSVLGFRLLRSDRGIVTVTPDAERDLFNATVGGLGLTGIILDVTFRLVPITSTHLDVETIPFSGLEDFFSLCSESERGFEHTVAWVDCSVSGDALGRGIFQRANWATDGARAAHHRPGIARMPFEAPSAVLNPTTVRAFNALYYALNRAKNATTRQPYSAVFHPLDAIADWNKLYGRRGFFQYQCVIPPSCRDALRDVLSVVSRAKEGSFLAVLKSFGAIPSPGLLSFPMKGYTLALDFANRGAKTMRLLSTLDDIVSAAGGRLYPAKDGRIPRAMFEKSYSELGRFSGLVDPKCVSDFWLGVT